MCIYNIYITMEKYFPYNEHKFQIQASDIKKTGKSLQETVR